MKKLKVVAEFTEPLLGTLSGNKELAKDYIASKAPDGAKDDELIIIENIDEKVEKSSTIFNRDENGPFLWDYQIKGFIKESLLAIILSGNHTKEELKKFRLTQYMLQKTIDLQVFVSPRRIPLVLPDGAETSFLERPLRAKTMQGERIALARSETAPVGTICKFEILTLQDNLEQWIKMALEYGGLHGLGQWRNAGYGRFSHVIE